MGISFNGGVLKELFLLSPSVLLGYQQRLLTAAAAAAVSLRSPITVMTREGNVNAQAKGESLHYELSLLISGVFTVLLRRTDMYSSPQTVQF